MTQTSYNEEGSYQYLETLTEELQQAYTEMNMQLDELKERSCELFEIRVTNLLEQGRTVAEELNNALSSLKDTNYEIMQASKLHKELKNIL
ncbi:hypothetical protein SteCoe_4117 [Stentor coeruleus]|uniref:Uncharacterized protein n=1 Tax=Stentor coeruleus TaxID=5963 RepID=A0A1R2CVK2_9CILI|nr:hypothetical protein SteCoe_4117 [Stentor coeruleus]